MKDKRYAKFDKRRIIDDWLIYEKKVHIQFEKMTKIHN